MADFVNIPRLANWVFYSRLNLYAAARRAEQMVAGR